MSTTTGKRYAIRATRDHGAFYIAHLARLTNPGWTDSRRDAKTWASRAGAMRAVRDFRLSDVEIVEAHRPG